MRKTANDNEAAQAEMMETQRRGIVTSIEESRAFQKAKEQQRQIAEMRITIALHQQRPSARKIKPWLLASGSTEIRPRNKDWLDRATVVNGAMPVGQVAKLFKGLELVEDDGRSG